MKNFAKLLLYFTLGFAITFLAAVGTRVLSLFVEWAQRIPPRPETWSNIIVNAVSWALSMATYLSIAITLSYSARKRFNSAVTVFFTILLTVLLNYSISTAVYNLERMPATHMTNINLGERGLILSNSLNRNETAVVLINGMAEPFGPRVVASPDRPLTFYESTVNTNIIIPPVPFGRDTPWFINSINIDLRLNSERLRNFFTAGFIPYIANIFSLIYLLCSFGFLLKISVWPLVNLFLVFIVFRGILSLETFLNSFEIQEIFQSLLGSILPVTMTVPLIFFGFGSLIYIYSILVYISKRHGIDDI